MSWNLSIIFKKCPEIIHSLPEFSAGFYYIAFKIIQMELKGYGWVSSDQTCSDLVGITVIAAAAVIADWIAI